MLDKLKTATKYAESRHASSWIVGAALILGGVGIYMGIPRDAVYMATAGLVLVLVPLLNSVTD
ncbi:hypothetical protein GGP94_003176 [Salinibacter ruber]|uniref:hypothetical protein n=1 Tax=Salinibacter ruber TaxID=146919 RepID=UPI002169B906|nr:hypothetical protein [Salinibacter ruber]MCS4162728.1 hypothetical protein [Salinibacter ruber]